MDDYKLTFYGVFVVDPDAPEYLHAAVTDEAEARRLAVDLTAEGHAVEVRGMYFLKAGAPEHN